MPCAWEFVMETDPRRLSWGTANLNSNLCTVIVVCLVATLSYLASRLGGALALHPSMLSPLWPGCVLLVSVLLLVPRRMWLILIAAAFAAFVLSAEQDGVAIRSIVWLILADMVEVLTAALCLSYCFDGLPRLDSVKALARYSFFAVFLAPFTGAFVGALAYNRSYWTSWRISFFSEALGFLTLMPAFLGWVRKGTAWDKKSRAYYLESAALIATLVLFGFLIFVVPQRSVSPALLYSLVPFLLWSALRFGSTGVSTSVFIIAFLSIWGVTHGQGPFTGPGGLNNVLPLQLFLFFTAAPFMILAAVVEEHKHSEQALKKSEEKFSKAFRECPSAFAITRLKDDSYVEVNETFEQFTGYSRDELNRRTPFDIQLWENPSHRIELLKQLRTEGRLRNVEARFRMRDGRIRIGLASAELIEIDGEELLLSVTSDITELKQAQQARFRHAAIVESSDDAIVSKDLNGIITTWNAGAHRIFGFTEAEAVGQPITILIPPELRDEENRMLQRLSAGECIEHYETIRVTKEGKKINVSLTISPLRDSMGRTVGFAKIARDITDRKRAEQILRESEERFRLVADTAPVLVWMSGTDKLCTFFNKGWLNFTGRTLEQETGEGWASGVHPEDLERCLGTYSDAFDARVDFEMEYRLRRFDGKYRWIVDYGVPRFESEGTFCGYIGSCVDITDRKLSEESLEELSGRLITAQEEERTRIARELHDDFSQRLALLGIGLSRLWKKRPESEEEERILVRELWSGIKEISSDIHRLSHQLHSSKLQHVGLGPALMGLCEEISQKYGIQVEFTERGVSSEIPKDVALCLFRIAQEALGNVVKHSEAKQAQAELTSTKNEIRLRVVDAGLGFDPAHLNGDAGLGLVSMRERLRLVGGRLSVQSAPMRGTEILAEASLLMSHNRDDARKMTAGGIKS
jgi:PAS domain S-box-containing protein